MNPGSSFENYKMIFDIIIFDIDMPGINGIDTARKLREMDSNVTIIFVTNIAQYAINGYEVDAVDYILKPVSYYDFSMKFHRTGGKGSPEEGTHHKNRDCGRNQKVTQFPALDLCRSTFIICIFTPQRGLQIQRQYF